MDEKRYSAVRPEGAPIINWPPQNIQRPTQSIAVRPVAVLSPHAQEKNVELTVRLPAVMNRRFRNLMASHYGILGVSQAIRLVIAQWIEAHK